MNLFAICLFTFFLSSLSAFDQIVIWGHKLHSHTHSYIHQAFFRAFQEMGYPVLWLDAKDDVQGIDFTSTLFITEGQADEGIPLRSDCFYVLHNCDSSKYRPYLIEKKACVLQVYTDDVLDRPCEKIASCIYYDVPGMCLYMPWATDLLPREIDEVKESLKKTKKGKAVFWIGTIGSGTFGNVGQLNPFIEAAATQKVDFKSYGSVSLEQNLKLVKSSYMAPAIVGKWQAEKGYIPCRIFKNISYGSMGITNSARVHELFEGKIVYNSDTYQLFFDAEKRIKNMHSDELFELMDFVRDHHTYINRIRTIFDFIEKIRYSN